MNIKTDYWKTDKITPSHIKGVIRDTCESLVYDLLYGYSASRPKTDSDGITFGLSREFIMSRNNMDSSDTKKWDVIRKNQDPTRLVLDAIFSDGRFPKKLSWATQDIMDGFFDYMGLLETVKGLDSSVPFPSLLRYDDNIWENIHDDEE